MEQTTSSSKPARRTPLEKAFKRALSPIEEFIHEETSGGIVLMVCAVLAILIANSPFLPYYDKILHTQLTIASGSFVITHTIHHWINDGLMAFFFFVVGLEIKREVLVGELADKRQAILPIAAAIGGMIVPAAIYVLLNRSGEAVNGWGIPMATDIAFALGVLALLGKRIPLTLIGLLLAIAIVDDLGAVMVIAVFYTEQINTAALLFAAVCFLLLMVSNLTGLRRPLPYVVFGVLLWIGMLESGVHATLAGVLAALTVPATSDCDSSLFIKKMKNMIAKFSSANNPGRNIMENVEQQVCLQSMENYIHSMESPLQKMEHSLHVWVSFIIVPLFALANAGVKIELSQLNDILVHPVSVGIFLGLVVGKFVGISLFSLVVIKAGWSRLPSGVSFSQLYGVALLAGIGFTMSMFIGDLAFKGQAEYLYNAKLGVILASLVSGVGGYFWLRLATPREGSF